MSYHHTGSTPPSPGFPLKLLVYAVVGLVVLKIAKKR